MIFSCTESIKKNRKSYTLAIVIACIFVIFATKALASEADPSTRRDYAFAAQIKHAIENDNRGWLADQVDYPVVYHVGKKKKRASTRQEFLKHYDEIINPYVKKMISTYAQEDDFSLFKNSVGMMIGNGTVWFMETYDPPNSEKMKYIIIAFNNTPPELP